MAAKKGIDWEAIEREYKAGQLSIREIARQYDVSPALIVRKAKKQEWKRDLTEQIRKSVNIKLVNTDVNTDVNTQEIVEMAAVRSVEIVRSHRKYLSRLLHIADTFMTDLEKNCDQENSKLKMKYKEKVEILKAIIQAISKVIPLERQAFNLDIQEDKKTVIISNKRDAIRRQLENNPELKEKLKYAFRD